MFKVDSRLLTLFAQVKIWTDRAFVSDPLDRQNVAVVARESIVYFNFLCACRLSLLSVILYHFLELFSAQSLHFCLDELDYMAEGLHVDYTRAITLFARFPFFVQL